MVEHLSLVRLRVREEAQSRGWMIARLHREAAIDIKTLRKAWHNPFYPISLLTLEKIATALGIPLLSLLENVSADSAKDIQ
jgi:hypothetical protein